MNKIDYLLYFYFNQKEHYNCLIIYIMSNLVFKEQFYSIIYGSSINNETKYNNFIQNSLDEYQQIPSNIIEFWKNYKNNWFSHKIIEDNVINIERINTIFENRDNFDILFSYLLQYDQIFRHPNRCFQIKNKNILYKFATHIAFILIHHHDYNSQELWIKVFILLALRHTKNINIQEFVLKKINQLRENNEELKYNSLMIRFFNASLLDYYKNKLQLPLSHSKSICNYSKTYQSHIENEQFNWIDILDKNCETYINKDKIEKYYSNEHSLELLTQKLFNNKKIKNIFQHISNIYDNIYEKTKYQNIIISISGGLDSMVLSLLTKIYQVRNRNNFNVKLVHICYNNRECVNDEIELLKWWSSYISCELIYEKYEFITRENNSAFRQMYEDVTRKIRFQIYNYSTNQNDILCLGHNKDDTFENILTNLDKKIHFDNLKGMENYKIESDIQIVRPCLDISKIDLNYIANILNIPYLEDSTPKWSKRGNIRDNIRPTINKTLPTFETGLETYVEHCEFYKTFWNSAYNKWKKDIYFINTRSDGTECYVRDVLTKRRYIKILKVNNFLNDEFFMMNIKNLDFWIKLWFDYNMNYRPSNKSFTNLMEFVSNIEKHKKWDHGYTSIHLHKNCVAECFRLKVNEKYMYTIRLCICI